MQDNDIAPDCFFKASIASTCARWSRLCTGGHFEVSKEGWTAGSPTSHGASCSSCWGTPPRLHDGGGEFDVSNVASKRFGALQSTHFFGGPCIQLERDQQVRCLWSSTQPFKVSPQSSQILHVNGSFLRPTSLEQMFGHLSSTATGCAEALGRQL